MNEPQANYNPIRTTEETVIRVGGEIALYGAIIRSALQGIIEANDKFQKGKFRFKFNNGKITPEYKTYLDIVAFLRHAQNAYNINAIANLESLISLKKKKKDYKVEQFILRDLAC